MVRVKQIKELVKTSCESESAFETKRLRTGCSSSATKRPAARPRVEGEQRKPSKVRKCPAVVVEGQGSKSALVVQRRVVQGQA